MVCYFNATYTIEISIILSNTETSYQSFSLINKKPCLNFEIYKQVELLFYLSTLLLGSYLSLQLMSQNKILLHH